MLGLGRALGETMAVTFVIGNATRISPSLFAPGATIASTIANEFPEAGAGSLKLHSLLELGFILFVISFIVLAISRALVRTSVKVRQQWTVSPAAAPRTMRQGHLDRLRAASRLFMLGLDPVHADRARRCRRSAPTSSRRSCCRRAPNGGLLNAIVGSLIQIGVALVIGTPIGVMAGTYLAEQGAERRLAGDRALRQRHPALGAVDPDRPLRLPAARRHHRRLLRLGRHRRRSPSSSCRSSCAPPRTCSRWCRSACARPPSRSARRNGR